MHWVLVDLNQCELNWIQIKGQEDIKPVALLCGPACLLPYYRMLLLVLKSDRLPFSFLSILSLYPNPSLCPFPESDSWIFVFGFAGIYHASTWALWMLDWPLQLVSEPALCFFSSCSKYTIADAFLYEQSTRSRGNKEREAVHAAVRGPESPLCWNTIWLLFIHLALQIDSSSWPLSSTCHELDKNTILSFKHNQEVAMWRKWNNDLGLHLLPEFIFIWSKDA